MWGARPVSSECGPAEGWVYWVTVTELIQSRPYSSGVLSAGAGLGLGAGWVWHWVRGRARVTRVTCSNSGHSRTPHPLTHSHWQTHCHANLTTGPTGNLWPMSPVSALSTYLSVPPCLSRPCHVSRSDRARVTLAHASSLSRGLSSCGLCHVSQCDVVTQCCHDYPLCPCLSVCYHGLSHTDSLLQYRPSVSVLLARPPLPRPARLTHNQHLPDTDTGPRQYAG